MEINGKLYDTKRGVPITQTTSISKQNQTIDGFVAPKPQTIIKPAEPITAKISITTKKTNKQHQTANYNKPRITQKSTTLMRKSVKKPTPSKNKTEISGYHHANRLHIKNDRANNTSKSPYISRYNRIEHQITKKTEPIAVVSPPKAKPNNPKTISYSTSIQPKSQLSKSEKLFSNAILNAKPMPKQKIPKTKRHKAIKWSSSITAGILLFGFIAYLNFPNISIKFASTRAGFSASMPNYKPSGYAFKGPINYTTGRITINFKSNTDDRSYSINQEVSSWNSRSLQENYLVAKNKVFTIMQENGRTIYMYDNGNATWVNGGVWYQIESNSLSSEQLLSIASSI